MYPIRPDLHLPICYHCGKPHQPNGGLLWMLEHHSNRIPYQRMGMRAMMHAIAALFDPTQDIMHSFEGLDKDYQYLNPMTDLDTASDLDKRIFSILRDMEIKQMLRMKAILDAERYFANTI